MAKHLIVALNRQYGSGGKEVGKKLAKALGIPLYDSEILDLAAEKSGIKKEYFEKVDEKPTDSFLYALAMNTFSATSAVNPMDHALSNDHLFNIQADVIRELAEKESFVLIGRCGEYILRDDPDCISVYLHADVEKRKKRIQELYLLSPKDAAKRINSIDKKRESYYGYYAGKDWDACTSYDLSVDTGVLGIDATVELLKQYIEIKTKDN